MRCPFVDVASARTLLPPAPTPSRGPLPAWFSNGVCVPIPLPGGLPTRTQREVHTRPVSGGAVSYTHLTLPTICSV
eukprot:3058265-Alexandrium_andersonii.AAC.1